jgi:hypothetical protein
MDDFHSQIHMNAHGLKAEFLWNKVHPLKWLVEGKSMSIMASNIEPNVP